MKRKTLELILILAVLILTSSLPFMIKDVKATSGNYIIETVNHEIDVMYNGYIFINDTIRINGTATNGFLIGFPYEYGRHVLRCTAYNSQEDFPVGLNVPLGNRSGFYSIRVDFPNETPETFSVVSVLSNDLLQRETQNVSRLDFPTYPSLAKNAGLCNVSIHLPEGSKFLNGTVNTLTYLQEDFNAFAYSPGNVTFSTPEDVIRKVDVERLEQEIQLSGMGQIEGADTYHLTNRETEEVEYFRIVLPENSSDPRAHDKLGRSLNIATTQHDNKYDLFFRLPLDIEESTAFTVKYSLPKDVYVEQKNHLNLKFPAYLNVDYFIKQSAVTFVLPEGGKMLSFENVSTVTTHSATYNVFQEQLTIKKQNVFFMDSFSLEFTYGYNVLWLSLRPTLWIWALATVGCTIAVLWHRPKAPIPIGVPEAEIGISSEEIRSFLDTYERRRKIIPKLRSLETKAQKGKIPRRQYKVQRKTLETQLRTLSRKITDTQEKMQSAGGRYRDLVRRLEVAETEIAEVESNIRSIQVRHRRGELSLGAYRKLLSEYEQRKDKAQTTINEILITLREEIH